MPLLEKGAETFGAWNAVYEGQMETHLMVAITPAADCIVAAWKLDIDTKLVTGGSLSYTHAHPVYVLFNPWCLNDTVYMPGKYRSTIISCMFIHSQVPYSYRDRVLAPGYSMEDNLLLFSLCHFIPAYILLISAKISLIFL